MTYQHCKCMACHYLDIAKAPPCSACPICDTVPARDGSAVNPVPHKYGRPTADKQIRCVWCLELQCEHDVGMSEHIEKVCKK